MRYIQFNQDFSISMTLISRVGNPRGIKQFVLGVVVGVTACFFIITLLNDCFFNMSIFRPEIEHEINIQAEVGDHSKDDHHHKMLNSTLAEQLYDEVRILCWIMTGPNNYDTKAKHVKATWGKKCNHLIFMSTVQNDSLPAVALPVVENRDNLWGKTKEALKYVYKHYYDDYDWFFKADDDTYAIMENMRYFLRNYSNTQPIHFGYKYKQIVKQGYMSGGSGYVMSKEALKRFVEDAIPDPKKCKEDNTGAEDAELGKCLEAVGVEAGDSRDASGRNTFLPLYFPNFLIPGDIHKNHWIWNYHYYPLIPGMGCCSDNLISVHYVSPHDMYMLEFLIYHVKPFGIAYNPTLEDAYGFIRNISLNITKM